MDEVFGALRSGLVRHEREIARRAQRDFAMRHAAAAEQQFRTVLDATGRKDDILLARARAADGSQYWAGLPADECIGTHTWVTGASGSGKSFWVLGWLFQILTRIIRTGRGAVIIVDLKGEIAALILTVLLPALVRRHRGDALLRNLRVIRPFGRFIPELRVTLPEPGVPREVQAMTIASALEDALADELRTRMNRVVLKLITLAIEKDEPLTRLTSWLENPEQFARLAQTSADPLLRQYAAGPFLREAKTSLDAVLARLDLFSMLRETQLALSAERCVSFADALESGLTIVDLGDPPAGAERAAKFWAGITVGKVMRAVLSRVVRDNSAPVWILFDEVQEAITGRQADQFARLVTLARFKKVGLAFTNQMAAAGQLDAKLVKILRTNTGLEAIFRTSYEDARALAHALPHSGDPKAARAERQELLEMLPVLPRRQFLLWPKAWSLRARVVTSPRLDLNQLKALAAELPGDLHAQIEQGTVARPRHELEALVTRQERASRRSTTTVPFLRVADEDEGATTSSPRLG